jgi:GGDEF domain-containing protein
LRLAFGILFLAIIVSMAACARVARCSGKRIGSAAGVLLLSLILPMVGNGIIILSGNRVVSLIGCYLYYLGLDVSIAALLHFSFEYCRISWPRPWMRYAVHGLLLADVIQLVLNPVFHHAFEITEITVDGFPYYRMIPHLGQNFHRAVDYLLLAGIIVIFIRRLIRAPRLQKERYSVILFALVLVSAWETAYIFSGSPIDRSMIGFGAFGLLVFYFSLNYRPMRLLDRMLSGVVSEQKDPMYFFDAGKRCIWMNHAGAQFLKMEEHQLEEAEAELKRQFSPPHPGMDEWTDHLTISRDGETRYIELTKQPLINARSKMDGFYFYIRDLTEEHRETEEKLYNARHDQLTGLFNRDYLYECTRQLLEKNPEEDYLIIHAEISDLKVINDLYGNAFGDYALKSAADWLCGDGNLKPGTIYGRLGGDSFGVCIPEKDFSRKRMEANLSEFSVRDEAQEYRPGIRKFPLCMTGQCWRWRASRMITISISRGTIRPCATRWSGTGRFPGN